MDHETEAFYDAYWPVNVPILDETRSYMLATIRESEAERALDAGCGHGLCSVVLSELATAVDAVDISSRCIETARAQAREHGRDNISFSHQDLQKLDFPDEEFDLVWCWGVAMMAPDPERVIGHLARVTRGGGVLYLGLYLKTWLSPFHQATRHFCRAVLDGPRRRRAVCWSAARATELICRLRGQEINLRPDNHTIEAQAEDWLYPPFKKFFSIEETLALLDRLGFDGECIQDQLGRMRSATNFVVRGVKRPAAP